MEAGPPQGPEQRKKRRRDRDRTQANPSASYPPNKRVTLSYDDSDVEDPQAPYMPAGPPLNPKSQPDLVGSSKPGQEAKKAEDEDEDEDEGFDLADTYGLRLYNAEDGHREVLFAKHATPALDPAQYRGAFDPTFGQQNVLPFAEVDDLDGWVIYAEPENGLEYLKRVRLERETIPNLLKAEQSDDSLYDDGTSDTCGYWDEDAYIARPYTDHDALGKDEAASKPTPTHAQDLYQEAYHFTLKQRFVKHRELLAKPVLNHETGKLDEEHLYTNPRTKLGQETWARRFQMTLPLPVQVRSMNCDKVLMLLEIVSAHVLHSCRSLTAELSAWTWALLARLPDVGQMDGDQVATVRELGKQALAVLASWQGKGAAQILQQVTAGSSTTDIHQAKPTIDKGQPDGAGSENETLEKMAGSTNDHCSASEGSTASENTLATLEMIVTIVGDVFGQRDLLKDRPLWSLELAETREYAS